MRIGCDIVENKRFDDVNDNFINLVLTDKEKELYKTKGKEFLYGRFAGKEAIMKCLKNTKELSFLDIEILSDNTGKPITNIKGIDLSISHEKSYTIAVALYID